MNELEKIIHAILHALGLDHGIPTEVIETAKADASIAIKTFVPVAEKAVEAVIVAEVPPAFAPVANAAVEGLVAAGEARIEKAIAPETTPEADASLSPDAPMVQV